MPEHANPDFAIVHLSDIHFRKGDGDLHDPNRDIRNELLIDLRRLRAVLGRCDGIVVSGDIAFAGRPEEYTYARSWLETLREQLGCPSTGIMVTPGNHDVDRTRLAPDTDVARLHAEIRKQVYPGIDDSLTTALRDPETGGVLLSPMAAYNAFAEAYGCSISAAQPYWERSFPVGGRTVRIRGITTTLLSGPEDDEYKNKMLYGVAQRSLIREEGVCYVVVGHHPPSWSFETDEVDRVFAGRAFLQLFGHKHDHWLVAYGTSSVRLHAGAVHPSRHEPGWLPRYSAVAIGSCTSTQLKLRVYPRRWSTEEQTFIPDYNLAGSDCRAYDVLHHM